MTTEEPDSLRSIGISPRERLERIENLLGSIDAKLDVKADKEDLRLLEGRVREMELHGSSGLQELRGIVTEAKHLSEKNAAVQNIAMTEVRTLHQATQTKLAYYAGGLAVLTTAATILQRFILK